MEFLFLLYFHVHISICKNNSHSSLSVFFPFLLGITIFYIVRLNLINHMLALFHDKFTCNTALRNPIFRWESCKGSV